MASGGDDSSMVVALVFVLALAVLAGAVLLIRRIVRNKDVLHGSYVENDNKD
jgi:hypothetical protein